MTALTLTLVSALTMGLLGSLHCVGMCGGIVSALTFRANASRPVAGRRLMHLLAYNIGRVLSYAAAGATAGFVSAPLLAALPGEIGQSAARWLFGGFTVALGLYLAGWWRGLAALERLGARLWQRVQPLTRRLMPIDRPGKAFAVGCLWGWLPCGMLYTALAWSLASASASNGALIMIAFGVGTMPSMLVIGVAVPWLRDAGRRQLVLLAAGLCLVALGTSVLLAPWFHVAHHHV